MHNTIPCKNAIVSPTIKGSWHELRFPANGKLVFRNQFLNDFVLIVSKFR